MTSITSKIPPGIHDTNLLRSMSKRRGMKLETTSQPNQSKAANLVSTSKERGSQRGRSHTSLSQPLIRPLEDLPVDDTDKPSVDLRRQPRGLVRKLKLLPGRLLRFWHALHPELTVEQIEQQKFIKLEKYRDKLCQQEGRIYARKASLKLEQLGLRESLNNPNPNQPRKFKRVKWDMVTRNEDFTVVILHMNTSPQALPSYVQVSKLGRDQMYSDELLPTLGKYNRFQSDDFGVTLTVYRQSIDQLPLMLPAEEFWRKLQPQNMPLLAIPIGVGENSKRVFVNLEESENLLVAGGTGWGKSMMLNQIISFWPWRGLKPSELQLILFDLKHGLEFGLYEKLPHLYKDEVITSGIIGDIGEVMPAFDQLIKVLNQRMEILKRAKCKNIQEYNKKRKPSERWPSLVIFIDEWAAIKLTRHLEGLKYSMNAVIELAKNYADMILNGDDPDDKRMTGLRLASGKSLSEKGVLSLLVDFARHVLKMRQTTKFGEEAENKLVRMSSQGRAAGLHYILATQNPSREVLTGLIGVNFHTRVVFNTGNVGGSMAALGDQRAYGLLTKGRCILLHHGDESEIQAPFMSESLIKETINYAITGKHQTASSIDLEEILKYSLLNMQGFLDVHKLYGIFREKGVARNWIMTTLHENELEKFSIDGNIYQITRRGNGLPRRLLRVE